MTEADAFVVRSGRRVVHVPVADVLYLKAELKYVTLRTKTHTYIHDESLAEMEPRLRGRFIRIHRNALVAVDPPGGLFLQMGEAGWSVCVNAVHEWLPVSRRQLQAVRAALGDVLASAAQSAAVSAS